MTIASSAPRPPSATPGWTDERAGRSGPPQRRRPGDRRLRRRRRGRRGGLDVVAPPRRARRRLPALARARPPPGAVPAGRTATRASDGCRRRPAGRLGPRRSRPSTRSTTWSSTCSPSRSTPRWTSSSRSAARCGGSAACRCCCPGSRSAAGAWWAGRPPLGCSSAHRCCRGEPAAGAYLLIEQIGSAAVGADDLDLDLDLDGLVASPGVAGAWSYAGAEPRHGRLDSTAGLTLTVCYLDEPPVDVAAELAPVLVDRWADGRRTPMLAAPFEMVVPGQWDRHLP